MSHEGLTPEELQAEIGIALPAKEVVSIIDVNADINVGIDAASPIDLSAAANLNVAAPIQAAAGANVLTSGSDAASLRATGAFDMSITTFEGSPQADLLLSTAQAAASEFFAWDLGFMIEVARKIAAPAPLWPNVISPDFCLSNAINSETDLAGTLGWTTSASGVRNRSAIPCRSLRVSNGMCLISVGLAASELAGASSV